MCGIIAYTGHRPATPIIIEGLKRLEYRGYDSAGIAFCLQNKLSVIKTEGKLSNLEQKLNSQEVLLNTSGIGHTRWATHGLPTTQNAHPHLSQNGRFALVHNGIIENFKELKKDLISKGITFTSDTDTEVLVQLIAYYVDKGNSILQAIQKSLNQVKGSYAFALIECSQPQTIWAGRCSSPLILGKGQGENFIASDIPAFLPYTKEVIFLEDYEIAEITPSQIKLFSLSHLTPIARETVLIHWDIQAAQKEGYKHFMLKEIFEQPQVIENCLRGRIDASKQTIIIPELNDIPIPSRLKIVACGTSYHAGLWAKYLLEDIAKIPVEVEIASEFRYRESLLDRDSWVMVISQSGETADTLAGLRLAKEKKATVIGLCNVIGSSIARESDITIYTQAGPEISVASTKAMCSQMITLLLLTLFWAKQKQIISQQTINSFIKQLVTLPEQLKNNLTAYHQKAKELTPKYAWAKSFFYLGRGIYYPLALEGALKLKEISYIHAEGYAAGEMKHGPIALIDPEFPTFALAPKDNLLPKIKSNLQEVQARGGKIIALTEPDALLNVDDTWFMPRSQHPFTSFFVLPALQLFAYETAIYLGKDVDQPRNLAKSVTVE
ncbi:MAG: glutamine--fructose-6-phosphate transaminase (isomerizing) [Desulfonauticus sp.]|nr:glutamine--fructose-6-phosphate transaminase (isomerizing) [Desulfonauticus sp.]